MAIHAPITGARTCAPINPEHRARIETEIEAHLTAVELLVARLDAVDGDADLELYGDEEDGSCSEDDWMEHSLGAHLPGPGCPISDPGGADAYDDQQDVRPIVDREAYRFHLRRIRRDRCDRVMHGHYSYWTLRGDASPAAWVRP